MIGPQNKLDPWRFWPAIYRFLNTIRYLLVIAITIIVLQSAWRIHWLLAIIAAFPVYVVVLNLTGLLMLLLLALPAPIVWVCSRRSSDGKVTSEICKSIRKQKPTGMWAFGTPKIEGDELERCLAYYEAQGRVAAFQTKEADLFNNTLVKYLYSVKDNPVAASKMCKAADRLVQAVHEVNRRHEAIQLIPDAASAMHIAWHITYQSVTAWAEATLSSMEALADGMIPDMAYVKHLVDEYQEAWRKAQEENKRFLMRIKVEAGEITGILSRIDKATAVDSWQPQPSGYDFTQASEAIQQA